MTNPYIRAAAKHPGLKTQAKERLEKRKGKPDTPPGKPDKPLQTGGQGQPKNPGAGSKR